MEIISNKIVKTRKIHRCFACDRSFPVGTEMQNQVNKHDGEINSVYTCKTCNELMRNHKNKFINFDKIFEEGCVISLVSKGQTPEDLLAKLNRENIK